MHGGDLEVEGCGRGVGAAVGTGEGAFSLRTLLDVAEFWVEEMQ